MIPVSPHAPSGLLTQDWKNHRPPDIVAVAGVDKVIRTFGLPFANKNPLSELLGHQYAVREIAWSPHWEDVLISASYDMTVRVWSNRSSNAAVLGIGKIGGLPGGTRQDNGCHGSVYGVLRRSGLVLFWWGGVGR